MTIEHGGNIIQLARSLGLATTDLVDMSSNLSPLGQVAGLKEELTLALDEITFLPEVASETLCAVFAEKNGLSPRQVAAGNGTTEFIHAVPQLVGAKRGVIVQPTYGDYQPACQWAGIPVRDFFLTPDTDFSFDPGQLARELKDHDLVFLCNPNNPTGQLTDSDRLIELARERPACTFLVDESYIPFVDHPSLVAYRLPDNLFVLFSFSKAYNIPGLRLGIMAASEKQMIFLREKNKPWGVNRLAQVAGRFLLQQGDGYLEHLKAFIARERPRVVARMEQTGKVTTIHGVTNFILSRLNTEMNAAGLRSRLLARHLVIRDCSNFKGLDRWYFRISIKDRHTNDLFLQALAKETAAA